jgi:hypothetical protein
MQTYTFTIRGRNCSQIVQEKRKSNKGVKYQADFISFGKPLENSAWVF